MEIWTEEGRMRLMGNEVAEMESCLSETYSLPACPPSKYSLHLLYLSICHHRGCPCTGGVEKKQIRIVVGRT